MNRAFLWLFVVLSLAPAARGDTAVPVTFQVPVSAEIQERFREKAPVIAGVVEKRLGVYLARHASHAVEVRGGDTRGYTVSVLVTGIKPSARMGLTPVSNEVLFDVDDLDLLARGKVRGNLRGIRFRNVVSSGTAVDPTGGFLMKVMAPGERVQLRQVPWRWATQGPDPATVPARSADAAWAGLEETQKAAPPQDKLERHGVKFSYDPGTKTGRLTNVSAGPMIYVQSRRYLALPLLNAMVKGIEFESLGTLVTEGGRIRFKAVYAELGRMSSSRGLTHWVVRKAAESAVNIELRRAGLLRSKTLDLEIRAADPKIQIDAARHEIEIRGDVVITESILHHLSRIAREARVD